ncbi:MAG TPA: ABC transporter ATP-binding protein [Bacillota bacterium]|nr:ABC transporter ATP-binding protein [Bacillota bacterium]
MVECENLVKIYQTQGIEVVALQGLDLIIEKGELMAIIGNSGSGKSTLLNTLGGLDRPTAGKLTVNGQNLLKMTDQQLIRYKLDTVGFVWQNNARNLIPYLTALDNVELPMMISGKTKRREKASEILDILGLSHRKNSRLSELSGGEQQRVGIAIALANSPKLLLADEPTGSVDTKTSDLILDTFKSLNRSMKITIIIVTHDRNISRKVDRVVAIRDGRTSSEFLRQSYTEKIVEIGATALESSHIELAVLDRAGRLQIPREYLDSLGLSGKNKIRVEMEPDRISLLNPDSVARKSEK